MNIDHEFVTGVAKSWGLFYMMAIFIGAIIYALWPSNQEKFDRAAKSILKEDDE